MIVQKPSWPLHLLLESARNPHCDRPLYPEQSGKCRPEMITTYVNENGTSFFQSALIDAVHWFWAFLE